MVHISVFSPCSSAVCSNRFERWLASKHLNLDGLSRCATGTPPENDHLRLNPHSIVFLHGPGKDQPSGSLKHIAITNVTMSESAVRSSCRCELNTFADACKTTVFKSPSAALTVYSSVRNRDSPGVGFGRGRLNSPQVRCEKSSVRRHCTAL